MEAGDNDYSPETVARVRWQRVQALCPGAFTKMADPRAQIRGHQGAVARPDLPMLAPPCPASLFTGTGDGMDTDDADDEAREEIITVCEYEGVPVRAHVVNIVHKTTISGSEACLPWLAPDERASVIPSAAVAQAGIGILSRGDGLRFTVRYRAPYRSKHRISTADPSLRETAAMSEWYAGRARRATLSLMAAACGIDTSEYAGFAARDVGRLNVVAVVFLPFDVDLARLIALHGDVFEECGETKKRHGDNSKKKKKKKKKKKATRAMGGANNAPNAHTHTTNAAKAIKSGTPQGGNGGGGGELPPGPEGLLRPRKPAFEGVVGEHPHFEPRRLLVFHPGTVICVGSKTHEEIVAFFAFGIPRICDARV